MPIGFSKACRTCLTLDGTLISIYDSISYDGGGSVTDIIKDITKIKPMKSDGLPELVCQTCLNEINRCYSFKVKCLNSDNILRKLSANEDELDLSHRQQVAEEGEKDCKPIVQNFMIVHNPDPIEPEYEIPIKIKTEVDQDDQSFGYFVITSVCSQNDQTNETDDAATIKTFQTPPQGFIKEEIDYELDSYNTSSTRPLTCTDADQSMYFDSISLELARPQLKLEPEESFQLESPIINATLKPNIKCPECDKEFLYSSQLKKHMRSHKPLACPTCNKTFKFQAQLRSHLSVSHRTSNPFKCEVCPRSFPFPSKLKEHLRSHKGIPYIHASCERKIFKCEDCPRTFYFPSKLKEHLRSHRNKNPSQTVVDKHTDELSSKDVASELEQKYEHKDVGTSLDASASEQSTIWVFENQRSTRRSVRIQREELKTPDGETDQKIQSHESSAEAGEIKTQTKKSEKFMQVENSLDEQHPIPDEESTRSYNCPHCSKVFKYLSRLNEHIVCHSESRPFDCTNCGKFFKSPGQLARHLKTSHKVVTFGIRRKTFGRRGNFKNKAIKSFIRNKIDNGTNATEQINVHQNKEEQKTEAQENQKGTNQICEQNNEQTEHLPSDLVSPSNSLKHPKRKTTSLESPDSSNTSKAKHSKTLEEERTYRCEQCDLTFHVSARFYSHMRSKHGIERPFACQLCGRGFKSCGNLRSHVMITHEKLKPFKCNNCKRTFSCKSNLKKHFASRVWNHSCGKEFNSRRVGIKKKISDRRRLNYEDETADSNEIDESKHRNIEETAIESTNESLFVNDNTDLVFKSNTETLDDGKAEVSVLSVETRIETTADDSVQSVPVKPVQEEANDKKPTDFKPQKVVKKTGKPKNPLQCPQCNKVFVFQSYLKKHLHSHSNDRPFKCTICGKCFKYKVSLKSHYMVEHAKNKPYKCDKCPQEFVNEYNYRVHRNGHIKAIKRKTDAKRRRLANEISGKTETKSTPIEEMDKSLEVACEQTGNVDIEKIDPEKSEKHMEEAQNSVELSCVPSSSLNSNAEQVQDDEPKSTFECPHCDKVYLFASYLKKHMRCHNDERPHVCKTCGKSFKEYWRLRSHVMAKHALTLKKFRKKKRNHLSDKPLLEEKQTQSLGNMNVQDPNSTNITEAVGAPVSVLPPPMEENRPVVENEKPHCTQCDRVFQYASQLETHMRSHTGERPYSCPTCNKTFKQTGHLRTHIHLTHKGLKPFQCTMCLRGFDNLHHLRAHEKAHRKKLKSSLVKSEAYSIVETSTAESVQKAQDIIQDQIIQDFEKLELHPLFGTSMFEPNSCLTCSECAQTFELQSDLDEHMKTHSGVATRPFNCSICYKTFKQEAHLKNHTKMSHTKTRNYKCNECNRTFLTFYILSKHMRSHKSKKNSTNGKSKRGHKRRGKINKHKNLFEPLDISTIQVTPPEPEKEPTMQTDSSAVKNNVQTNCALCSALVDSHNLSEHMKQCLQTPTSNHFEMKPEPFEQTQRKDHPLFESLSNQDDDKTDTGVVKQCSECNTEFCSFSTFADHMLTHQVERPFVCSTCGKAFKKNAHLRNHIMVVHKRILPYKCDDCPRVFSSKYNLNIHSKTHIAHRGKRRVIMKKNYYKDPPYHAKPPPNESLNSTATTTISQKTEDDYSNLSGSVSIENENIVRCTLCFISVQSDGLSKHMQDFHNLPESLTCVTVKKEKSEEADSIIKQQPVASETSSKIEMTRFDLPQKRQFKCPTCDKEFPHLSRLNEHMRGHSDERPFICLVCGNTYKRHGHLTTHIATCHKRDKPFKCKKCPRTFSNRLNLNIHSQTHLVDDMTDYSVTVSNLQSDMHLEPLIPTRDEQLPTYNVGGEGLPQFTAEETHPCTFCPTVLKSLTQLVEHMKIHTSDQPFICSLCGKAFVNNDDLASHRLLKHNTSKPYQCDQCDRDFTSSVGLKKHHLWIHNTAYKQMRFKIKNKKLNTKRSIEEQQKHPSGVPQCYICKKNFTNNWVLKEHMKTHPNVRPFTCLICGHSFAKKYNLKIHVMGHRKIRPFKCHYCPQSYCTNYLLKHHMRTHTQEPKEIQNDESHSESLQHHE